jgi:hypothetical protein
MILTGEKTALSGELERFSGPRGVQPDSEEKSFWAIDDNVHDIVDSFSVQDIVDKSSLTIE